MMGGILETPTHPPACVLVSLPVALPVMAHTEEQEQQSKELERCLFLQRISIPEPQVSTKYPQNNRMGR